MKNILHNVVGTVGLENVVLFALAAAYLLTGDNLSFHYM